MAGPLRRVGEVLSCAIGREVLRKCASYCSDDGVDAYQGTKGRKFEQRLSRQTDAEGRSASTSANYWIIMGWNDRSR